MALKLNSAGVYQWHSFYGSSLEDSGSAIVLDGNGGLYLAGSSQDSWNGPGNIPPLNPHLGSATWKHVFALKLDLNGDYGWHTFYSIINDPDMAVDGLGGLYLTGYFGDVFLGPGGQPPVNGTGGLVVVKLNQSGAYQWHTQYPGDPYNRASISAGADGRIHLVGANFESWDGPTGQSPLNAYTEHDFFWLEISLTGSYLRHSFWGTWSDVQGTVEMASDTAGNIYLLGASNGNWLGPAGELPLNPHPAPGQGSLAIVRLSPAGIYQWHTFFGDSFDANSVGDFIIGLDGSLFIAGASLPWLGPDSQAPLHPHCAASADDHDFFVLKLDATGHYLWHTFYGSDSYVPSHGHGVDSISAISQDESGDLYISGSSYTNWLGPAGQLPLHAFSQNGHFNLSVFKLSNDGAYYWHTFFGSATEHSGAAGLWVDSGELYITGSSGETWDGPAGQAPLHPFGTGTYDNEIVVLKLSTSGDYRWHTFYGAPGEGDGAGMLVGGGLGGLYIVGRSYGSWNGDANSAPLHAYSGGQDLFVLKLTISGAYQWHTFYGSSGNIVNGENVAFDPAGQVYIAGTSYSSWIGPQGQLPQHSFSNSGNLYVLSLDIDGNYNWHTFHGENFISDAEMIFHAGDGIYLAGVNYSSWYPQEDEIPINPSSGRMDFFAMKLGPGTSPQPTDWTLMIYLATDNDLESRFNFGYRIMNQLEAAANNPAVKVVVFWDRHTVGDAAYYDVQYDTNTSLMGYYEENVNIWYRNEPNMGAPSTLINFVDWAKTYYPANHYALILADHGTGLGGAMYDYTDGDHLTVKELGEVMQIISDQGQNPLDIVFMDACLMGMLEDAYQFRGTTRYYIASQSLGWDVSSPFYHFVNSLDSQITTGQYAQKMAEWYAHGARIGRESYTISVSDLSQLDPLVAATNEFAQQLNANMAAASDMITGLALAAQRFDENGNDEIDFYDAYMDLYHFASMFALNTPNPDIQSAAEGVKEAIYNYILFNDHHSFEGGYQLEMSHGVSIFFPATASSFYNPDNYDFAVGATWPGQRARNALSEDVSWGSMLVNYFQTTQPGGPDDPTPPELQPLMPMSSFIIHLPLIRR